ncbi:hypothetical protein GIB67_019764 [Kingdonia uniflora]|uniref:F-box domain-containing protein n=1 Tax=Kingdonia uniflora TaxID=39325 RepID=A0A7J7MKG9_9MAGN|nr:hypothetical protein GIB67_019764 [Kingdonia uniflora]
MAELIPGLPEEIGLECMIRLPYTAHRDASRVCKRWRDLVLSRDYYNERKQIGNTHKVACLVQSQSQSQNEFESKSVGIGLPPSYQIVMFDSVTQNWEKIDPVPKYPDGLPLFSQLSSVEGKLVVMGGWSPVSWEPVKDVFVYDFTMRRWRQGKDMPSKRSFFATAAALDGRVYVAGGHDECKNALRTAWAYDVREDEWTELTQMSEERDECEGALVFGGEFWVVSGYATENQGSFVGSAEVYEIATGRWRRVEGAWGAGKCPRGCVGVGKDGGLICLGELDSAVSVGACGVRLDESTLVTGSEYQGGPQGFFLLGQNGKLEKIQVPDEFSGFVQSGCCSEI